MGTTSATPAYEVPERRLIQRRHQADRRSTLRWHPHGGDRRQGDGRRKEDNWQTMKLVLKKLFRVFPT